MADEREMLANPPASRRKRQLETKAQTRAWVLGSLVARGAAHPDLVSRARRSLPWFREFVLKLPPDASLVPFSVVHDLGWLLSEGPAFPFRARIERQSDEDPWRGARVTYENRFLNALLHDPSFQRASEAIQKDRSRNELVARAIGLILAPLTDVPEDGGFALNAQILRELDVTGQLSPEREAEAWDEMTGQQDAHMHELARLLDRGRGRMDLVKRAGQPAFKPEDLKEIEDWDAFKKEHQRIAGRRIVAFAAEVPPFDLRKVRIVQETGPETELPDAGTWAEGGYTGITTKGAIESLIPTEVAYLGEDVGLGPVDLFQLRDIDQQLLYWEREEGELQRIRRAVHVVVAPDNGFRIKMRSHREQLAVAIYGLFMRLVWDLAQIFKDDAIMTVLHIVTKEGPDRERAEEDAALLRVLLGNEIRQGTAEVVVEQSGFDVREMADQRLLETRLGDLEKAAKDGKDKAAVRAREVAAKLVALSKGVVYGIVFQAFDESAEGLPAQPKGAPRRPPRIVLVKVGGQEPARAPGRPPRGAPIVLWVSEAQPVRDIALTARDEAVSEITG